jgi:hypothetical protein
MLWAAGAKTRAKARVAMGGAIRIEVAPGELIDKLTILEIKRERIKDPAKLANIAVEFAALQSAYDAAIRTSDALQGLRAQLRDVNSRLWVIEDDIRDCEREQDFGPRFIELARAVYRTNDRRSEIKREINLLLGSSLIEEKSYRPYEPG